jgi:3-oxoacyl-[acyl-carrier protein] reductase
MEKKVILVTGGSKGIGAEIVKILACENTEVILNYNNSKIEAENIKKELLKKGVKIEIFKADLTVRNQVNQLIQFCIMKYGKIDVLINNAGISQTKLFTEITDNDWNLIIQTNLYSIFYTTQETVKYMIEKKSGCIINISSIWGEIGASCEVHYSVSKAGVDAMTKSLAKELGPSGIRVNSIAPGIIDTQMNEYIDTEDLNEIINDIPLKKVGTKKDIAKCVKWLIEDTYTTGQVISINGGWKI